MLKKNYNKCIICGAEFQSCINCLKYKTDSSYDESKLGEYRKANNYSISQMAELYQGHLRLCEKPEHYFFFLSLKDHMAGRKTRESLLNDAALLGISESEMNNFNSNIRDIIFKNTETAMPKSQNADYVKRESVHISKQANNKEKSHSNKSKYKDR